MTPTPISPRSIDAMVAEHVMNLRLTPNRLFYMSDYNGMLEVPHYSTQIAAAMEVVDKVGANKIIFEQTPAGWFCELCINAVCYIALAPTRELAICLAALKVKGIKINNLQSTNQLPTK